MLLHFCLVAFLYLTVPTCQASFMPPRISDICLSCLAKTREQYSNDCVVLSDNKTYCSKYQISEQYFSDCQRYRGVANGTRFEQCALDDSCAANCTRTNLNQYATMCQNVKHFPNFDCADFATLHYEGYSGPESCGRHRYGPTTDKIEQFWNNLTTVCKCSDMFHVTARLKSCHSKLFKKHSSTGVAETYSCWITAIILVISILFK